MHIVRLRVRSNFGNQIIKSEPKRIARQRCAGSSVAARAKEKELRGDSVRHMGAANSALPFMLLMLLPVAAVRSNRRRTQRNCVGRVSDHRLRLYTAAARAYYSPLPDAYIVFADSE